MKNTFRLIGKEVVQSEINALKLLKKSLNKDFDKIVNTVIKCSKSNPVRCRKIRNYIKKNFFNTFVLEFLRSMWMLALVLMEIQEL